MAAVAGAIEMCPATSRRFSSAKNLMDSRLRGDQFLEAARHGG